MRTYLLKDYAIKTKQNRTYTIVDKFGEGASCIAYYAVDGQTKAKCILKEYYPAYLAIERDETGKLHCKENEMEKFVNGKKRFEKSVDTQIKLRNIEASTNQIFYVNDRFEENGTSYVVVPQYIFPVRELFIVSWQKLVLIINQNVSRMLLPKLIEKPVNPTI